MAKTTITINATDTDGKKVRNNITYVNPEISNSNALILAQKISSLTTDTYESTERIDTKTIDNEQSIERNPTIKELANNQTYDGSLLRIPFSKLTNNNANNVYQYQLEVPTELALRVQPSVILKCEVINIEPAGSLIRVQNYTWYGSLNFVNKWVLSIGHSKDIPLANYPLTYSLKLSISEGDGFQAYSQDINVEIYNDTEGRNVQLKTISTEGE